MARRAVAGGARPRRARPQDRLLRPRRRVAGGRAARVAHPRAGARVLGRRHLRRARASARWRRRSARSSPKTTPRTSGAPRPTPRATQWVQTLLSAPLFILSGVRWLLYLVTAGTILNLFPGFAALPHAPWWVLIVGLLIFATPFGRMSVAAASARAPAGGAPARATIREAGRCICGSGSPSRSPIRSTRSASPVRRGSRTTRERSARRSAATSTCTRFRPSPGMLEVGDGASIEPEVDLSGYWIDGDLVRIGPVRIGADATVGTRSTLAPGTRIGQRAQIAPGSAVFGRARADQSWAGSPAVRVGGVDRATGRPSARPRAGRWLWAYAGSALLLGAPADRVVRGRSVRARLRDARRRRPRSPPSVRRSLWLIPATLVVGSRLRDRGRRCSSGSSRSGSRRARFPVRSRIGLAGLDDRASARLRADDPLPALLEPLHPGLAPDAGSRGRAGRRGIDGPPHPVDDAHRGRRLPRRRHDGRVVRAAPRVAAHRRTCGSASARSSATPAWPPRGTACRATALSRCSRRRPSRRSPARRGSDRPLCACADSSASGDETPHVRPARATAPRARPVGALPARARLRHLRDRLLVLFALAGLLASLGPVWALLLSGLVMLAAGALAAGVSVAAKWLIVGPDPRGGAAPVVELRVAHRGVGHLHRDGRSAVVRAERRGHACARGVAARARRDDRTGRLVRQLLAARARPRDPRRRIHRQPRDASCRRTCSMIGS